MPTSGANTEIKYYWHAESSCLWTQNAAEPAPDDPLVEEVSKEQAANLAHNYKLKITHSPPIATPDARMELNRSRRRSAAPEKILVDVPAQPETQIKGDWLGYEPKLTTPLAPLHIRLRPQKLEEVIGQKTAVKALTRLLTEPSRGLPHLFLFTGPSGTGKTTLARIVASHLNCPKPTEMDAATHSGVDDTRAITEWASFHALDGTNKVLILDEVQALSKAAWQALLKVMEEPPAHVFFALCTTDASKVPETIKTRAHVIKLGEVNVTELDQFAQDVIHGQGLHIPDGGLPFVIRSAMGSVRQLLVSLSLCDGATDVAEVQKLLEQAIQDDHFISLARMLVSERRSMSRALKLMAPLRESNEAESVRCQLVEYVTSVFFGSSDKIREDLVGLLDQLSKPCPQRGGWAQLASGIFFAIQG